MAARLLQWMMQALSEDIPMRLMMHITSLHIFRGDYPIVDYKLQQWEQRTKGTEIGPDEEDTTYGAAV
jgi:hypothetical protein